MPTPAGRARLREHLQILAHRDARFAGALARVGCVERRTLAPGFGALVRISIGQSVSVQAATAIHGRLLREVAGHVTPARVASLSDAQMRAVGLSLGKVHSLRTVAARVEQGLDLARWRRAPDRDVRTDIEALPGFGPWSADMYLLLALQRSDVWPVGDIAVRDGLRRVLQIPSRPSAAQARELGRVWSPLRSAAALLCWQVYLDERAR